MSQPRQVHESKFRRVLSKVFVSGFVVLSFAAYVVHEHVVGADRAEGAGTAAPVVVATTRVAPTRAQVARPTSAGAATAPPTARPVVIAPTAKPANASAYQDGVFTGQKEDAFFGVVQVQATIRDGKIADVEFLEYPSDRRTSQRINSFAMPYLQQEAIQTQSARVDVISGATLTSEAFIRSLQTALVTAKNGS